MPYATHSRRTAWFEEQKQTSKLEGKPLEGDTLLSITRPGSVLTALLQGVHN